MGCNLESFGCALCRTHNVDGRQCTAQLADQESKARNPTSASSCHLGKRRLPQKDPMSGAFLAREQLSYRILIQLATLLAPISIQSAALAVLHQYAYP